jgi:hypothetical protein
MTIRTRLARLENRVNTDATGDARTSWGAGMAAAERDLPSVPGAGTGAILRILEAAGAGEWVQELLDALPEEATP